MKKYKIFFVFMFAGYLGLAQKSEQAPITGKSAESPTVGTIKFAKEEKMYEQKTGAAFDIVTPGAIVDAGGVERKSKYSEKPTIIKIPRESIKGQVLISDLITNIPDTCNIISCLLTVSYNGQAYFYIQQGNILHPQYLSADFIVIEQLRSSCAKSHKANYKIIFQ